jgi:hypothetical protein
MFIYVANNTIQNRIFEYRAPEKPAIRRAPMGPGQQVKLPDDLDQQGAEFVVDQLRMAGGVDHDNPNDIKTPFSVVYRVGKAIAADDIEVALEAEGEARQNVAAEMIEKTGMTNFNIAGNGQDSNVQATSLEIVELESSSDKPKKDGVNVEVKVDKKAPRGKATRSKKSGADR